MELGGRWRTGCGRRVILLRLGSLWILVVCRHVICQSKRFQPECFDSTRGWRMSRERDKKEESLKGNNRSICSLSCRGMSQRGSSEADWARYNMRLPLWALRDATATLSLLLWLETHRCNLSHPRPPSPRSRTMTTTSPLLPVRCCVHVITQTHL